MHRVVTTLGRWGLPKVKPDLSKYVLSTPLSGRIWHLSDVHVNPRHPTGSGDVKDRPLAANPDDVRQDPLQGLLELARNLKASYLVVSGDFVDMSAIMKVDDPLERERLRDAAFEEAAKIVGTIADALGIPAEGLSTRVVVCPGNHDVRWGDKLTKADKLVDFQNHLKAFLSPTSKAGALTLDPDKTGVLLAPLHTAFLGGTRVRVGDEEVPLDVAMYSQKQIDDLLSRMKDAPRGLLQILVAHHPPGSVGGGEIELKAFESPIGADEARRRLSQAGFSLFLHGHKHVCRVQREKVDDPTYGSRRSALVGAGTLFGNDGIKGFNILDYVVDTASGRAVVAVTPYLFEPGPTRPLKRPTTLVSLGARSTSSARMIRVIERISSTGDARTDIYYLELPTPSSELEAAHSGWAVEDGRYVRRLPRILQAESAQNSTILAKSLDRLGDVEVEFEEEVGDRRDGLDTIAGSIRVSVPTSTAPRAISLLERSWTTHCYSLTRSHQIRLGQFPSRVPGLRKGWEYHCFVVREPCERLELYLRLPFAFQSPPKVEVKTFVETTEGELRKFPMPATFPAPHIDYAHFAKRIRVSVRHPIPGIAYCIQWELPDEDPQMEKMAHEDSKQFEIHSREADRLRKQLQGTRTTPNAILTNLFVRLVETLKVRLVDAGCLNPEADLEAAIFVPTRSILIPAASSRSSESGHGRCMLVPALATYSAEDPRWESEWDPGVGVAGRAYAINHHVYFKQPRARARISAESVWETGSAPIYVEEDGLPVHSSILAIPLRHPSRRTADLVFGSFCIGVYGEEDVLDVLSEGRSVDLRDLGHGQVPPLIAVYQLVKDFLNEATMTLRATPM